MENEEHISPLWRRKRRGFILYYCVSWIYNWPEPHPWQDVLLGALLLRPTDSRTFLMLQNSPSQLEESPEDPQIPFRGSASHTHPIFLNIFSNICVNKSFLTLTKRTYQIRLNRNMYENQLSSSRNYKVCKTIWLSQQLLIVLESRFPFIFLIRVFHINL